MKIEVNITNELFAKEVISTVNLYRNGEITLNELTKAVKEIAIISLR